MRRFFSAFFIALGLACSCSTSPSVQEPMHGVVLSPDDIADYDWPGLASRCGINTIGVHLLPSQVAAFLHSGRGRSFLHDCDSLGIIVEYQLHALSEFLPRELFSEDSTMFRMDGSGRRTPDFNCCVHSEKALEVIAGNAASYVRQMPSGNHRYYFWVDDDKPMCRCPQCSGFSDSEQALIIENRMLAAIRKVDPSAKLAHLAFQATMPAPRKVVPEDGIFLEFAPIHRVWDRPLSDTAAVSYRAKVMSHGQNLRYLRDNLEVFDATDAVVLEYWLDSSLASRWHKPAVEPYWHKDVCASDIATYASHGIRNITTFAVYMDSTYFSIFPATPVEEYGAL